MPRHRTFTAAFKAQVVLEVLSGIKSQAELAREHRLKPDLITRWKRQFLENAVACSRSRIPTMLWRRRSRNSSRRSAARRWSWRSQKSVQHLEPAARRELAHELAEEYPVTAVCEMLGLARSSYYHEIERRDDDELRQAVEELSSQWPTYGYRRITAELRRAGWVVNHKRIARMMADMGLQARTNRRRKRTTDSRHDGPRFPNLVLNRPAQRPDEVWVGDITYVVLGRGFVYLAVVMDVFTRAVRGWHLSRRLDHELALTALQRALESGQPEVHHSDQGVQYASEVYVRRLQELGVQISMASVGAAWQNGRHAWRGGAFDTHHQGGGGVPERVPRLCRRLPADRTIPGRCLHAQTYPLGDGLSDAGGVHVTMAADRDGRRGHPLMIGRFVSNFWGSLQFGRGSLAPRMGELKLPPIFGALGLADEVQQEMLSILAPAENTPVRVVAPYHLGQGDPKGCRQLEEADHLVIEAQALFHKAALDARIHL
jgi:putative transposase